MVFIMPFCLKRVRKNYILAILLLIYSTQTIAEFSIYHAETKLYNGVYLLNAELNYRLNDTVVEALHNGVNLTLLLSIKVKRERWYMWDQTVTELIQRYELKYFALSKKYMLSNINTGIQEIYSSLETAVMNLNKLENFPLIDQALIAPQQNYIVYLKIQLDIEALPAPLRPVAYFSADWRLASDWYICELSHPSKNG
jgi:hypothetical protein